ncbi:hypothetical protein E5288_WYG014157 [Bos mutus]|uniref:Uncharacterized protein n=1 Tax=Bos mutus TaxID=72004 RepID=A0A6B0R4P5_9CETA|nr:hypothetical protein [Bos mutus]
MSESWVALRNAYESELLPSFTKEQEPGTPASVVIANFTVHKNHVHADLGVPFSLSPSIFTFGRFEPAQVITSAEEKSVKYGSIGHQSSKAVIAPFKCT